MFMVNYSTVVLPSLPSATRATHVEPPAYDTVILLANMENGSCPLTILGACHDGGQHSEVVANYNQSGHHIGRTRPNQSPGVPIVHVVLKRHAILMQPEWLVRSYPGLITGRRGVRSEL